MNTTAVTRHWWVVITYFKISYSIEKYVFILQRVAFIIIIITYCNVFYVAKRLNYNPNIISKDYNKNRKRPRYGLLVLNVVGIKL